MIKLVVFDLDGVLLECKEIHYEALNQAISSFDSKYVITPEEHTKIYDGLPTKKKLSLLTKNKGLPAAFHPEINSLKQELTIKLIKEQVTVDQHLRNIMRQLKDRGLKIYVASNSIRETIKIALLKLGLIEFIDHYISNEDVKYSKPHSEMYLKAMIHAGVNPHETVIVEDSPHGRQAASHSGAHVCGVDSPSSITEERIFGVIDRANDVPTKTKWSDSKMNVLLPMAGGSEEFTKAGYTVPRYLIPIQGKYLIQRVVESIGIDANYIYLVRKEENEKYNYECILRNITPNCTIIEVDQPTDGAACTTLLAKELIDNDQHLVIAFSDQCVEYDSKEFIYRMLSKDADGGIVTFEDTSDCQKWSFVTTNDIYVTSVKEKVKISDVGTCGVYYWKHGKDYVAAAEQMIAANDRTNNLFFVAPVFNHAIKAGKKILWHECIQMNCVGNPTFLEEYLTSALGKVRT